MIDATVYTGLGILYFLDQYKAIIPITAEAKNVEISIPKFKCRNIVLKLYTIAPPIAQYFKGETAPARSTVAVKTLPKNVLVEVDVIAFKN